MNALSAKAYAVIEAPSELGLRATGTSGLPAALRDSGLLEDLRVSHEVRVPVPRDEPRRDEGNLVLNVEGIATFSRSLACAIGDVIDRGEWPLVLGGDCSILLGPLIALRRRGRYGLLFLDGHADFYSPETEPNGEVASMELSIATGREPEALSDIDGLRPLVREDDVVAFGIRDTVAAQEHSSPDVRETGIQVLELAEVRRLGIDRATTVALERVTREGIDGFWIHVDADVLNDDVMNAVDYRMPDGLRPAELRAVLRTALTTAGAVGLDVTIYNPTLDDAGLSSGRVLASCIREALLRF